MYAQSQKLLKYLVSHANSINNILRESMLNVSTFPDYIDNVPIADP